MRLAYLAGKITGLPSLVAMEWRYIAEERLKVHNPLEGMDIDGDYTPEEIVIRNKYYIDKCDIILAEMDHKEPSIGTIGEIVYGHMKGKPIITWGRAAYNENPWIKFHVTRHFETLTDAIDYIVARYPEVAI